MRLASLLLFMAALLPAASDTLVDAVWLQAHLKDADVVVLDSRTEADYAKGHLPGAVSINAWDYLVDSSSEGERAFQREIARIFGPAGVRPQDRVVIYDAKLGTRGARAYWMLRYAGHPWVRMLGGGFDGWRGQQLPISMAPAARAVVEFQVRPHPAYMASARDVNAHLQDRKVVILDVRTREEFDGKTPATAPRRGHVPGATWIEWTQFLNAEGTDFQSPEQLRALLAKHGVTPDQEIVTYCQRGARAAAAWAALEAAGYHKSRNYIGSWNDWAGKKELPVE